MAPRMHWLWLYGILNIVASVIMFNSKELIGDATGNSLVSSQVLFCALSLVLLSYFVILGPFFTFLSRLRVKKITIEQNEDQLIDRLGLIVLMVSLGFLLFNLKTGSNIAGNESMPSASPLRYIWVIFPADALFFIFYGYGRKSRYFHVNLVVWLISNLLRGWVGMLLFIAFFEWCHAYRNQKITKFKILISTTVLLITFPLLTAIKFFIRSSSRVNMSLAGLAEVSTNVPFEGGLWGLIGNTITGIVARLQVVSNLIEVIRIKYLLQTLFRNGQILPFWLEGSIGDLYYKFDGVKPDSVTLLFPKVHGFMGAGELDATNINIGFMGWYFIAPSYFVFYLLFVSLLGLFSICLVKKIGFNESSKDMLWLMWLMFMLPPWFAVLITYIYALVVFLCLKILLSSRRCDSWFPDNLFSGSIKK